MIFAFICVDITFQEIEEEVGEEERGEEEVGDMEEILEEEDGEEDGEADTGHRGLAPSLFLIIISYR